MIDDFLNKIINGDSTLLIKEIPDSTIDLAILDPPYLTTKEKWDKVDVISDEFVKDLFRVLKNTGSVYVWCGLGEKSQSLINWFPIFKEYFYFKDLITWKKTRGIGMKRGWLYTREEIMWFVKDNKKFFWNEKNQYSNEERKLYGFYKNGVSMRDKMKSKYKRWTNVWVDVPEITFYNSKEYRSFGKFHYTPKPEKLIERIVLCSSKEGDLVFDPFCGSGVTAVVSKKLNRNFICVDIDPDYCKLAQGRLLKNNEISKG